MMKTQDAALGLNAWLKLDLPNILDLYGVEIFCNRLPMVSTWMELGHVNSVIERWPPFPHVQDLAPVLALLSK
jgi:hypothetical protein